MRKTVIVILSILFLSGCSHWLNTSQVRNDERYGRVAIRLSEFSSQVIYYYRAQKQDIPQNFDGGKFIQILKQLPPDQINQKDVDSMVSLFKVDAHVVNGGFSVMLCGKNDQKIMEDFASPRDSVCRFPMDKVEIKSWNDTIPCLFEVNWQKYCLDH